MITNFRGIPEGCVKPMTMNFKHDFDLEDSAAHLSIGKQELNTQVKSHKICCILNSYHRYV